MVMWMVVTVMMRLSIRRNDRTSQNDECDGSKKQRAQLHSEPSPAATPSSGLLVRLKRTAAITFSHYLFLVMMFQA